MYHRNPRNDGKLLDKHQLTSENIMLHVFNKIFRRRKRPWPNFEYYPEISERDWDKSRRTWVRTVGEPTQIPNDCLPNSLPFQPTCLVTEHHISEADFWVLSAVLMMLNCSSMFRRGYWRIITDISVERATSAFIVWYCYTVVVPPGRWIESY